MAARLPSPRQKDRILADALPHIIWTCDARGTLEWVNDRWYELTGLSEEETHRDRGAIGAAIHPDDHDAVTRGWGQAIATAAPSEFEYRVRRRSGSWVWHRARMTPVHEASGAITRWVGAALEMHEHRRAEEALRESERRFEAIFNLIPQPTAMVRASDGVHLMVNDAWVRLSGFSRMEVIGRSAVSLGILSAEHRAEVVAELLAS